jgi:Domain of unknown function (DUF4251)
LFIKKNGKMKMVKSLTKTAQLFIIAITICTHGYAQDSTKDDKASKESSVKSLVDAKSYVFIAQTVLPAGGRIRQLTSYYDLEVSKDTIVSALPYFGRAYTAPIDPSEGGINFTSTNFDYTTTERKKGGWDISIKPKDAKDVQQIFLTISEKGYTTLQVLSNNRQAISFNGYITDRRQKRK